MSARRLRIVSTEVAESELNDILLYTEQEWGEPQRQKYRELIWSTITGLAGSPLLGRARDELSRGLRSFPVGSHVLYYRHTETTLFVARIMHNRQDPTGESWE